MIEATSPSSATDAVVDASAVIRALVDLHPGALEWLERPLAWPSLLYAEVAHASLRLCRAGRIDPEQARDLLDLVHTARAQVRPVGSLVGDAWELARERRLSVYDACYVVLAEALDAPLVTADPRLAEATPNAVLLTA